MRILIPATEQDSCFIHICCVCLHVRVRHKRLSDAAETGSDSSHTR